MMFKSKKKVKDQLLKSYFKIKSETFYFDRIGRYFYGKNQEDTYQVISDRTYQDLDLDEVFMYLDRTVSNVGQQYLYSALRTIPRDSGRANRMEGIIDALEAKPAIKEKIIHQLARLNQDGAYYLPALFQEEYIQKPKWFWFAQFMAVVSVLCVLFSFVYTQLLLALIGILTVNYLIHYGNKKNVYKYAESIVQLLVLNQVCKELMKLNIVPEKEHILSSTQVIDNVGRQMSIFKLESKFENDFDGLIEIIKALFLLEPLLLFNVLNKLETKREAIHQLYTFVGEIDMAISVASLRSEAPYFTKPQFSQQQKHISTEGLYHPLIDGFVANSLEISNKSLLLTGSNMSGKTTFIRTVGINVILSQTINTCFARKLIIPKLKIHSAIRIADDLMSEKSYYFEEVVTIKKMLEESSAETPTLFLLDEIFKGTNTVERIAAGKSVLSYLNKNNNLVLVATHDLELTEFLENTYDLYHFTELIENEKIVFDYKLKTGHLKSTNAIKILEVNDYPEEVIDEAKGISFEIRKNKIAKGA